MSNDISYIIKVVDDFSANIRKFQNDLGQTNQKISQTSANFQKAQQSAGFFTQNLKDMGKAAGIFIGVREALDFGKDIFNTKVQMDSMSASLAAILPKFDKTKSGTQLAAEEIDYLRTATNKLGVSFEAALPNYMQFLAGSKDDLATTRKTFEAFAGLSRMYGLNTQRFGLVINALSQMQSKGTVSMEELRQQLGDSLPGALKLFADAAGMTTAQFTKMVSNGQIGSGLIKIVGQNITKTFGVDIENAAKTLGARTAILGNQWQYFKTILSDQVSPVMSGTVEGLLNLTTGLSSIFSAISNQTAFLKLNEDLKGVVTMLRVAKGLLQGFGDILSGGKQLLGSAWNGAKGAIEAGTIGAYALAGGDRTIASDAFSELWNQQTKANLGSPQSQKVDISVNLNNAPKGTTTESKSAGKSNVKVGVMTNYDMGGY